MEKRYSKRIIVTLKAELISHGINYKGFIENVSENGLYIVTAPTETPASFIPDMPCEIKFQLPSGEALNLHCKVIWSYKTPPHGLTNSIGLEIIDPTSEYIESLKNL